jgi:hypothetical protein
VGWFPDEPEVPAEQVGQGTSALRYEEVSQDGRFLLIGLPHVLGEVVWRQLLVNHPLGRVAHTGVIPILTRFVLEGGEGPISVRHPLTSTGRYQLSHTVGEDGEVDRLMLNLWARSTAPRARMYGPPPAGEGETIPVGRVFAEHVFTRLFAPAGERKVVRFPVEGQPVPAARWTWRPLEAATAPPERAEPLDEAELPDEATVAFGLAHTDSNQHVNSLVYPRLFQEAALRRFAARGRSTRVLPRRIEIAYRKPCFAGDRARITLRAFALPDGQLLATGAFVPEGGGRAYCVLGMTFAE